MHLGGPRSQIGVKRSMDRTLAVGATSGSLSAVLLRIISDSFASQLPPGFECPICPEEAVDFLGSLQSRLDWPSLLLGLLLGLSLGPLLEVLYLLRQSWRIWVQSRLAKLATNQQLYRLG